MSAVLADLDLAEVDLDQLPPQVRMIARVIGPDATFALLKRRGGTQLKVPVNGGNSRVLVSIMGEDNAIAFCDAFANRTLSLPKMDKAMRQIRNRQIRSERADGDSLFELAMRHKLTTRQILNVCSDGEADSPQEDLF